MRFLKMIMIGLCLTGCVTTPTETPEQTLALGRANFAVHNYELAYKNLNPLAEKGNAEAEYAIGYLYYYGYFVARDEKHAIELMKKSAAQGNAKAKAALVKCCT